ncbi:hypothetical protein PHYPO_G00149860 [Pangasianodon hypophthalmus]|uniref:Uncharacterized protein n=1 Tax=Pangasianodon hypophthalmus TaxID=310915 RepID=A0A5N5JXB9_PANHP|nr:hypothetical protein PHYPO_G00149860 [Pangasianodon hypophthalmus]
MSEESLTSQDKEELKRRLELLQKEYERTAQRLQRAERREAVRKHVQSTISEQNRLLLSNTSATWEQSSSSSPEQLSNRNVPSDTKTRSRSSPPPGQAQPLMRPADQERESLILKRVRKRRERNGGEVEGRARRDGERERNGVGSQLCGSGTPRIQSQLSNGRAGEGQAEVALPHNPRPKNLDKSGRKNEVREDGEGQEESHASPDFVPVSPKSSSTISVLPSTGRIREQSRSPKPDSQPHSAVSSRHIRSVSDFQEEALDGLAVLILKIPASVNALRTAKVSGLSGLLTKIRRRISTTGRREFGQLKLEAFAHPAQTLNRVAQTTRASGRTGVTNIPEDGQVENEKVVLDPSPCGASLESSLPLMFTERIKAGMRAERREAVRKHVQSTISEQNRLLLSNTSATWEQSSSSSPEQLSNGMFLQTAVRFHLPDASPFSTLACTRSPSRAHRLRSKRSRLRLQIRERESDTEESQEKTREGTEERWREERGETASESEWTSAEKDKDVERGRTDEERKQEEGDREKTETLKKNEENLTPVIHQSAAESSSVNQSPLTKLLEVNDPPADQSALRNSPSTSYQSSASDHSNPSNKTSSQSCSRTVNDAEKSPGSTEFLTSCTLIEGLPFPVEYYVRTTRRMASAHSSVDLNAVIQSQLSNGRGRRRSSRGRVTSQPSSEKPPDKSGRKKRGPRGRRGRRRARESDSSGQSESLLQSPSSLPQEESEPIPSPKPDSQPHLSRELSPHSEVYPIFRKRRGRAGVSHSQIPASVNDSSHLLPSLTSLAEALRTKDFRSLSGLLTKFDVQDFHLPDEEFGQLKLERLCSSCSNAESVAYNACFRKNGS